MGTDRHWLSKCTPGNMPMPPLERYIHLLPSHVLKKRLQEHERGFRGYLPDFSTLKMRDDNELLALDLVREYTDVPVPNLVYQGKDYNVFTRIPGISVTHKEIWDTVSPRQREGLLLQTRSLIHKLARVPSELPGWIHSPHPRGILFRPHQLRHTGPFPSTQLLLQENPDLEGLVHPHSAPVFSHMDWDLSNVVIAENRDYVVGVVDWERAAWFPEAGKAIHKLTYQWEGWEKLFDWEEEEMWGGRGNRAVFYDAG